MKRHTRSLRSELPVNLHCLFSMLSIKCRLNVVPPVFWICINTMTWLVSLMLNLSFARQQVLIIHTSHVIHMFSSGRSHQKRWNKTQLLSKYLGGRYLFYLKEARQIERQQTMTRRDWAVSVATWKYQFQKRWHQHNITRLALHLAHVWRTRRLALLVRTQFESDQTV